MSIEAAEYLKGVVQILQEYDETSEATTSTLLQVVSAASGALLGAFFGGCFCSSLLQVAT